MPLPTAWSPWNLAQPSHVVKKNIDRLQRTILLTSCDRSMSPAGRGGQREREDADHTEQDACVLPRHGFRGRACASPESSLTRPRSVPPARRGMTDRAVAMIRSPLPRFPGGRGAYQQDGPSGNRCVRGKVLRRLKPCLVKGRRRMAGTVIALAALTSPGALQGSAAAASPARRALCPPTPTFAYLG